MGRISLQNNNKYSGRKTDLKSILAGLTAFVIIGSGLVVSGCGFPRKAEAAATDTPVATQQMKSTPTAKATDTPVPTPSPSPSPTPYVELTKEQKIELLNIQHQAGKYSIAQITVLKYEIDGCIFYALLGATRIEDPENYTFFDYFNGTDMFVTPTSNFLEVDFKKIDMHKFNILAPGYLNKNIKFLKVLSIDGIESDLIESGITPGESKYSEKIINSNGYANMSASEVGEYIVDVLPQENIPFPYLYLGLEPYTTPAPIPTATIAPTAFRDGNASIKYLMGERDLDTEFELENKTKRM